MSLIAWSDKYCINVSIIDQQHKKLVGLLNQLHSGLVAHREEETLKTVLAELVTYTEWHFLTEERLMKIHRYPAYEKHKAEHDALAKKVHGFQRSFDSRASSLAFDVLRFLAEWLASHILGTDKLLEPHLTVKAAARDAMLLTRKSGS